MLYNNGWATSQWRHDSDTTVFSFFDGHAERRPWNVQDPYHTAYSSFYAGGFGKLIGPLRGFRYDD